MSGAPRRAVIWLAIVLGLAGPASAETVLPPAGDVLPFRLLYGKPEVADPGEAACQVWIEGGRLHVRVASSRTPREVAGELRVAPAGVLKDVRLHTQGMRIRQPTPSVLQFDLQTQEAPEEISVVLAGDVETLRIDLTTDDQPRPGSLRLGGRQERPRALPADLVLTGARASWIERFGFD